MATAITGWQDKVRPFVPECLNATISTEVLNICRDFCRVSRLWFKQLGASEILEDVIQYALSSSDGDIVGLRSVKIDDAGQNYDCEFTKDRNLILPFTPSEDSDYCLTLTDLTFSASAKTIVSAATDFEDEGVAAGDVLCVSGCGETRNQRQFTVASVSTVTITVEESVVDYGAGAGAATISKDGLVPWVYLMPDKAASTVEDFLWDDFEETITRGALWKLMEIPKKPWTDFAMAEYYRRKYMSQRDTYRNISHQSGGYDQRPQQVKMRRLP